MNILLACAFYNISKTTLQRWLKNPMIKRTRHKPPDKIQNEALLKNIAQHPDNYMYERAQRLGCSKSGIEITIKFLGISQKKPFEHPKACPIKISDYLRKLNNLIDQ